MRHILLYGMQGFGAFNLHRYGCAAIMRAFDTYLHGPELGGLQMDG
jgi:hypothetical protein